jgi:hypothetical protein
MTLRSFVEMYTVPAHIKDVKIELVDKDFKLNRDVLKLRLDEVKVVANTIGLDFIDTVEFMVQSETV